MKRFVTKLAGCLTAAVLVMSMASCTGGGSSTNAPAPAATDNSAASATSAAPATPAPATDNSTPAPATDNSTTTAAPAPDASVASSLPPLQIDMFDQFANTAGIAGGWYGKVIKDKFNITLNIIAPNIAGGGDTLYQTRSAAGNLGDLILTGDQQLTDCYNAGLLYDITDIIQGKQNIAKFDVATKNLQTVLGTGDRVYALAENASTLSPTTPQFDGMNPNFATYIRWDYYKELGYPTINNYDDFLNILQQMCANHPTSDTGKTTYGLSFFKDWDGTYSAIVAKYIFSYGFQEINNSYYFINEDATQSQMITQDNGVYYNALELFFKANQMGLLDPDSPSNTWDTLVNKMKDGQVMSSPFSWNSADQLNTIENGNAGKGFMPVVVGDQTILAQGQSPYGAGSGFAVGSKAPDPGRIIDFLDWICSSEGRMICNNGPQGLAWDVVDGLPVLNDFGKSAWQLKTTVPDEYGGGNMADGGDPINGSLEMIADINPDYGVPYDRGMWPQTIADNQTVLSEDWNTHYNAASVLDYLQKSNKIVVSPGNAYVRPAESSDIQTERAQCGDLLKTASWQMAFAGSQAEFDQIWSDLKTQLDGVGYQDVLAVDATYVQGYKDAIAQTLKDTGTAQ